MDAKKVQSVLDIYEQRMLQLSARYPKIVPERADPTRKFHYLTNSEEVWQKTSHVWWAIRQCRTFVDAGRMDKAFRWLGFIQGALWDQGEYSVEEMANHNKPADETSNLDPNRGKKWRLLGYDTFEGASYEIDGEYDDEEKAIQAARKRCEALELIQPRSQGLQDYVYVVRPNGSRFQVSA